MRGGRLDFMIDILAGTFKIFLIYSITQAVLRAVIQYKE